MADVTVCQEGEKLCDRKTREQTSTEQQHYNLFQITCSTPIFTVLTKNPDP